jgi:hypothetical protein
MMLLEPHPWLRWHPWGTCCGHPAKQEEEEEEEEEKEVSHTI